VPVEMTSRPGSAGRSFSQEFFRELELLGGQSPHVFEGGIISLEGHIRSMGGAAAIVTVHRFWPNQTATV